MELKESDVTLVELRSRYIELFGEEPTNAGALDQIESQLNMRLPSDFHNIASFYSGGTVGGIRHHAIAAVGPATNLVTETIRLREQAGIPHSMLVLAEPPESLIVLATGHSNTQSAVIWLDSSDASNLGNEGGASQSSGLGFLRSVF